MKIYQVFLDTYHLDPDWNDFWCRSYETYFQDEQKAIEYMCQMANDKQTNRKIRKIKNHGYRDYDISMNIKEDKITNHIYEEHYKLPNVIDIKTTYYGNKWGVREIEL